MCDRRFCLANLKEVGFIIGKCGKGKWMKKRGKGMKGDKEKTGRGSKRLAPAA